MTAHQRTVMLGLMMGVILNVFEMSVVGTAMPRVVASLGGFDLYNWVFTAFMLTSTCSLPIFGKLGDQVGRKWVYIGGLIAFLCGSMACGLAGSMGWLIAARALQGLGAGAMFPSAMSIVGEIFPPAERGRAASYFGPLFMAGGLLGPILGGFIVDYLGWQWVFFASLPFGIADLLIMLGALQAKPAGEGPLNLDILGAALLIVATVPLLLLTRAIDQGASWQSPTVLGMMGLTVASALAFLWQESRAISPIIPLPLLRLPIFAVSAATEFLESGVLVSISMMLPLMAQGVIGLSASASGMILTPFMVVLVLANMATGQAITRLGRYRNLAVAGLAVQSGGLILLAMLSPGGTVWHALAGGLTAIGLGMLIPVFTIVVQNAVPKEQIGTATAGLQYFTHLGEAIGVTAIGLVFTAAVTRALPAALVKGATSGDGIRDLFRPEALARMTPDTVGQLRHGLATAFTEIYWIWAALALAALIVTVTRLVDLPLRRELSDEELAHGDKASLSEA